LRRRPPPFGTRAGCSGAPARPDAWQRGNVVGSGLKSSRNESKQGDSDVAINGIIDENGRAGRRPCVQSRCGRTNCAATDRLATGGERGADADNAVMVTVFLKHDQSRPLSELNAQLQRQGYYKAFPPEGVEVVSWYVMMGMGQVVTLRLPASRLRESTASSRIPPGAATARSSIQPTTTRRSASRRMRRRSRPQNASDRNASKDQPSLEICSSVTTRSIFSVLLLIR
jgi:hypothetical protein